MPNVRNPLAGLALTALGALGLSVLVAVPVFFLPAFELKLFYLAFGVFGVGMVAGRASLLGSIGLVGAFLGGLVGLLLFQYILWPTGWEILLSLGYGGLCGLGGMATGKVGMRKVEKAIEALPKTRRCARCGVRVGLTARKCWSCRAYLPPI